MYLISGLPFTPSWAEKMGRMVMRGVLWRCFIELWQILKFWVWSSRAGRRRIIWLSWRGRDCDGRCEGPKLDFLVGKSIKYVQSQGCFSNFWQNGSDSCPKNG